jgi:sulfur-oxidizing protein SoxA
MDKRIAYGVVIASFAFLQACTSPTKSEAPKVAATPAAAPAASGSATDEIARYRAMIADGNPADLYEMAGEELWKKPMGPKNATLQKCD